MKQKDGKTIPRKIVEIFLKNCRVCRKTEVNIAIVAGHNSIVIKLFIKRIQRDCIDMQGFVKRLT